MSEVEAKTPSATDAMRPNALGADGRTVQSTLDAADLPPPEFEVELGAGDALFIPAFAWHQVTSLEESISLNFFWGDHAGYIAKVLGRPAFRLCGLCE